MLFWDSQPRFIPDAKLPIPQKNMLIPRITLQWSNQSANNSFSVTYIALTIQTYESWKISWWWKNQVKRFLK